MVKSDLIHNLELLLKPCLHSVWGVVNGPSKNARLAKIKPNSRGLIVSYFYGGPSRSLDFFFNANEVSGSQKMYQSRGLTKSRIYHSTPLVWGSDMAYFEPNVHHQRWHLWWWTFGSKYAMLHTFSTKTEKVNSSTICKCHMFLH